MVSKKVLTVLIVVALLLAVVSIVVSASVSNMSKIPEKEPDYNINVKPDTETGQVGITVNKPAGAP